MTLTITPAPEDASTLESALALGRCGLRVAFLHAPLFGCSRTPTEEHPVSTGCTCAKKDCPQKTNGKHPIAGRWQKVATCDEQALRDQYAALRVENPNIGIVLGPQGTDLEGPYIIAIDVDAELRFAQLVEEFGPLPETVRCDSGRGYRLLFTLPSDTPLDRIKNITALTSSDQLEKIPGVDIKAKDGQIVIGPSWHYLGRRYSWSRVGELSELPAGWLLAILAPPEQPKPKTYSPGSAPRSDKRTRKRERAWLEAAVTGEARLLARLSEGQRNNTLYRSLCNLLRKAHGCATIPNAHAYVVQELTAAAKACGLRESEIIATVGSAENKVGSETKEIPPLPNQSSAGQANQARNHPTLPVVRIGLDADRVTSEAIAALSKASNTFVRGGVLVRVVEHENEKRVRRQADAPVIRHHTPATLTDELSTLVRFEIIKDEEPRLCGPSKDLLTRIIERGTYPGLRHLEGVVSAPILRSDGSVAQTPGYDETTGHLLAFEPELVIPVKEHPTHEDAICARNELLDLVSQFPFRDNEDRSAWLALVLTLLARPAIDGPCPLFLGTGNIPGCGKSRLMDAASLIATGRVASRATQPDKESEAGKLITSIVIAGDDFLLLDNVDRPLGGAKLNALLTGSRWKDRILGVNVTIDLEIRVVLAATGNNVLAVGDTVRRVLPIRLDSEDEHPERRTKWIYPDLLGHIRANRYHLVAAGLTILRAWHVAGRQTSDEIRPWGSFEAWGSIVPPALTWIGLPDPGRTREGLEDEDPFHRAIQVVIQQWRALMEATKTPEDRGLSIHEAIDTLFNPLHRASTGLNGLRDALATLAPGRGSDKVDARALGHVFRKAKRRVIGRFRLVQAGKDTHADVVRWTVTGERSEREKKLDRIEEMLSEMNDPGLTAQVMSYIDATGSVEAAFTRLVERHTDWRVLTVLNGAEAHMDHLASLLDPVPAEALQLSVSRLRAEGAVYLDESTQTVSRMP